MAHEVPWTKVILEEFIDQALLTEDEEKIMRTRVAGWSRTKQCQEFGMSMSALDKTIKLLKLKYDAVQSYDPILPPRKVSLEDKSDIFRGY